MFGRRSRSPELLAPAQTELYRNCDRLMNGVAWLDEHSPPGSIARRSVTWAHYPYRYMLNQLKPAPSHPLIGSHFELQRLSATNMETQLAQLSKYQIINGKLYAAVHSEVPDIDQITAEISTDMKEALAFTLENRLFAPNAEDELEVELALIEAFMDGVEPYDFFGNK